MRDLLTDLIIRGKLSRIFNEIPKYPYVLRDISFTVPSNVKYVCIDQAIRGFKSVLLKHYRLFDYYPMNGNVSYTYTLQFNHPEKTLSDEEVNAEMNRFMDLLKDKINAELRK